MSGMDVMFQLLGLLLGLSIAELLTGFARSWRISVRAAHSSDHHVRIGWLVPLLGTLVLLDQTHFWITTYELRQYLPFDYGTLLGVIAIIGGYYVMSTFVFPDEPAGWPDFDDYYLHTNRIIIGGMLFANIATAAYGLAAIRNGFPVGDTPILQHWVSITAAVLFFPGLIALWFVKSRKANLALLLFMNGVLLTGALGSKL